MAVAHRGPGDRAPRAQAVTAGSAAELFPRIMGDLAQVEVRLRRVVHSRLPVVPEVFLHTVHAGGKRVRPALALLAGQAAGTVCEATFDVAVAVELIHLASLIHDDVIDEGGRRRARLTANRAFGNKNAVLVADYTHATAYRLLAERCGVGTVKRLSETVVRMVEGELSQMYNEGSGDVTEPLYVQMIQDKTASLMALACELGARVSGGDEESVAALARYGLCVGTAFQLVDDLLDLTGDEERLGKPIGNDIRNGRCTLPLIYTLQAGGAPAEALRAVLGGEIGTAELRRVRELVGQAGGIDYAAAAAHRLADEARAELEPFAEGEEKRALVALAEYVVARTR